MAFIAMKNEKINELNYTLLLVWTKAITRVPILEKEFAVQLFDDPIYTTAEFNPVMNAFVISRNVPAPYSDQAETTHSLVITSGNIQISASELAYIPKVIE